MQLTHSNIFFYSIICLIFAPFISFLFLKVNFYSILSFMGVLYFLMMGDIFLKKKYTGTIQIPKYIKYLFLYVIYCLLNNYFNKPDFSFKITMLFKHDFMFIYFVIALENINLVGINQKIIFKAMKTVLLIAFFVILYQASIDRMFFINPDYIEQWWKDYYTFVERRLPSIYSWCGTMGPGMTFMPMLALIVGNCLSKKEGYIWIWFWIGLGIMFSFLSLARWVMVNMFLICFIVAWYHRKKLIGVLKYLVIGILVLLCSIYFLDKIGIDTNEIIETRILEKQKIGIENKSAGTRILAFQLFAELFPAHPVFGVGAQITDELKESLTGRSSQLHVGYLSLLYYYGSVGGILYALFGYHLMRRLYFSCRYTGNWGPFAGMACFFVANLTLNYLTPVQEGLLICLAMDKCYREKLQWESASKESSVTVREIKNRTKKCYC